MGALRPLPPALLAGLAAAVGPRLSLLEGLALQAPEASPSVHFLYTTGCNDYQLTASVVLDHSWAAANNTGRLTRVVAGCKSPEARELLSKSPLAGSPDFAVFFAKGDDLDIIPATGERYPARSRPHALGQWFELAAPSEDVVCLVDPDFAFLQPISQHPSLARVRSGRMVSSSIWQLYGDPSAASISREYKTGPVWLVATSDLRAMLPEWRSLTDSWPKVGDGLMREQFAFQASAEKHGVPADFVDDLATEMMHSAGFLATPYALHYFRSYNFGGWGFHKALASSGWYADRFNNSVPPPLECGAPLLQEPPQPPEMMDEALSMATLLPVMNAAFRAHREAYCSGEADAFAERGAAAFGLARLMQPISCPGRLGELTRYRVEPALPAAWDEVQALGGDRCSLQAQMLQLDEEGQQPEI
mmetsp:Transcript_127480/g.396859  ORF Transcript_127480/g.396859 Transcript_127480/m.396859 type:complete len:418 (-) Transcript_127480:82-1335(-)